MRKQGIEFHHGRAIARIIKIMKVIGKTQTPTRIINIRKDNVNERATQNAKKSTVKTPQPQPGQNDTIKVEHHIQRTTNE